MYVLKAFVLLYPKVCQRDRYVHAPLAYEKNMKYCGKFLFQSCNNLIYMISTSCVTAVRSFTISPAMISPATDGTNAVDPGMSLRSVHFLAVPGGHIQCCLQLIDISSNGRIGFSFE